MGKQFGAGNLNEAIDYYRKLFFFGGCVLLSVSILQFTLREQIIAVYVSDSVIQKRAFDLIWVISLLTFPDCFKGMLKGVFKSMAL